MSTEIREEKRIFTTFDTFSVVGLVAGVGLLVFSMVSNAMNSQSNVKAQIETQRLALQIVSGSYQTQTIGGTKNSLRGPASSTQGEGLAAQGRLGADPWGEPYYYRTYTDLTGKKVSVVFSAGPDMKPQTDESSLITDSEGHLLEARFQGDDIGSIQKSWP